MHNREQYVKTQGLPVHLYLRRIQPADIFLPNFIFSSSYTKRHRWNKSKYKIFQYLEWCMACKVCFRACTFTFFTFVLNSLKIALLRRKKSDLCLYLHWESFLHFLSYLEINRRFHPSQTHILKKKVPTIACSIQNEIKKLSGFKWTLKMFSFYYLSSP